MRKFFVLGLGLGLAIAIILSSCGGGGGDSSVPTKSSISILYLDNTPLVGTNLPVQTSTNSLVKTVQFFLDNTALGSAGTATEIIINTSTISDGTHQIRARGIAADNTFAENSKTFLVNKAEIRRRALDYLKNNSGFYGIRWPTTNVTIEVDSSYFNIAKATFNTFNKYCDLNLVIILNTSSVPGGVPGKAVIGPYTPGFEGWKSYNQNCEITSSYVTISSQPHFSTEFLVAQATAQTLGFNLFFDSSSPNTSLYSIPYPIAYLPFDITEALFIMYHEIPPGGQIPPQ